MLKHLNIDELVGLIAPAVIDAKRKALFLSIPEIAPHHAKAVELHAELLAVRPATPSTSPELQKVLDESEVVDARHDHLARVVRNGIEADQEWSLAADPPDEARAEVADAIVAKVFPGGMNIINASLLAESGNTARVATLLHDEPQIAAFLKSIPMRGKATLLDVTHRWIAEGAKLGALDRRREELEAEAVTKPMDKATMNVTRAKAIRFLALLQSNLEVSDAPAAAIETIRGPIVKASDRAAKRYAAAADAGSGDMATGAAPGAGNTPGP